MLDTNRKRVLIYSHDTYGLGHLRRSLLVAERLVRAPDAPLVLIVTGSPRAQAFRMPGGVDCLKLPAITKDPAGNYRPRTLGVSLGEILEVRTEIIRGAVRGFAPDLVLVDHAPVGVEGELIPVFEDLLQQARCPQVVLGLRDVIDDVAKVEAEWDRFGVKRYLDALYDRILVYGDPRVTTTAHELHLPALHPTKVVFTGYLGRELAPRRPACSNGERPLVLVTTGGGGDGQKVLRGYVRFLEGLDQPPAFRSAVVTGPFLSSRRQREIVPRFCELGDSVEIMSFTNDMEELLSKASAMISMGGYNSVAEIMASGLPALVVPREFPRREQKIRAERLAPHTNFEVAAMNDGLSGQIARFVESALANPARVASRLDHAGLEVVVSEIMGLMGSHVATRGSTAGRGRNARIR
jgi:predicted glycosyltransferase